MRVAHIATAAAALTLAVPMTAAPADAAGPGQGTGRVIVTLQCDGYEAPIEFAVASGTHAWSAAQQVGGDLVLVPTSFEFSTYVPGGTEPIIGSLVKGSTGELATVTCTDTTTYLNGDGSYTIVTVYGLLR